MTFNNCDIDSFRVVIVSKFGDEVFVSSDKEFKWSPVFDHTLSLTAPPQYIAIIALREKHNILVKESKMISVY